MGKDLKIKHSVSSPPPPPPDPPTKYGGAFFVKKRYMGERNFFGKIYWGMFYMGTNDQMM